jgi:PiT family inorganic phosphate transporter
MMLQSAGGRTPKVIVSDTADCAERYTGRVVGISAQKLMDGTHFLSAGVVSFARGLNDTPKVVAALIGVQAIGIRSGMLIVGVAMAVGGLLNARKVAHKVSKEITKLNHGQGLTSNLVTGFLVVFASRMGMPVSTTHVSCGALFGIGTVTGQGTLRVVTQIVLAWVLTLPISALFAAIAFRLLSS